MRLALRILRLPRWWHWALFLTVGPLVGLNLAVAFFGQSFVSPLSPFFLDDKAHALIKYFAHRPSCLFRSHGDLEQIARDAERREKLPPGLMQAIISVESENCVHRISYAGAMGPAQLMPDTAAELGVDDPFDPQESIDAAARYLKRLLHRTGKIELAVAAYNAGPGAVNGHVPDNGQTQAYVAKVMRRFRGSSNRGAQRQQERFRGLRPRAPARATRA